MIYYHCDGGCGKVSPNQDDEYIHSNWLKWNLVTAGLQDEAHEMLLCRSCMRLMVAALPSPSLVFRNLKDAIKDQTPEA